MPENSNLSSGSSFPEERSLCMRMSTPMQISTSTRQTTEIHVPTTFELDQLNQEKTVDTAPAMAYAPTRSFNNRSMLSRQIHCSRLTPASMLLEVRVLYSAVVPRGPVGVIWRADVVPGRLPRSPVRVANGPGQGPLPIHDGAHMETLVLLGTFAPSRAKRPPQDACVDLVAQLLGQLIDIPLRQRGDGVENDQSFFNIPVHCGP